MAHLIDLKGCSRDWNIAIKVSKSTAMLSSKTARRIPRPRPVHLLGETIHCGDTSRYLRKPLIHGRPSDILSIRWRKAAQRLEVLCHLLNRKNDLSIRNGDMSYKQLIRPTVKNAYPICRCTTRTHVRQLQVFKSKCLRVAMTASRYIPNSQIHEDLGVPFLAYHIRCLTDGFDLKLDGVWNLLFRQRGKYVRWVRVDPCLPDVLVEIGIDRLVGTMFQKVARLTKRIVSSWQFRLPCCGSFPCIRFSVAKRNPGHNMQSRGTVHFPLSTAGSPKCLIFAVSVNLDMNNLCFYPRKPSSRGSASGLPYWPIASSAMVLHLSTLMSSTATGNSVR
jgi:hypothetical protein